VVFLYTSRVQKLGNFSQLGYEYLIPFGNFGGLDVQPHERMVDSIGLATPKNPDWKPD